MGGFCYKNAIEIGTASVTDIVPSCSELCQAIKGTAVCFIRKIFTTIRAAHLVHILPTICGTRLEVIQVLLLYCNVLYCTVQVLLSLTTNIKVGITRQTAPITGRMFHSSSLQSTVVEYRVSICKLNFFFQLDINTPPSSSLCCASVSGHITETPALKGFYKEAETWIIYFTSGGVLCSKHVVMQRDIFW